MINLIYMTYEHAPAFINRLLSKHYDFFVNVIFVGKLLQKRTLRHIDLKAGDNYLDVGCGTGTLANLVKAKYVNTLVRAVDPDNTVLEVAKKKSRRNNLYIEFIQSGAESLPLDDNSQSVVTSSLAFHHMPTKVKKAALAEIKRVLKRDGIFILVDIGKPRNKLWAMLCGIETIVERKEYINDNLEGRIPSMLASSGFRILKTYKPYIGIYTWKCKIAA